MHRVWLAFIGLFCLLSSGCVRLSSAPPVVKSVFVVETSGLASPELTRLGEVIHDTAVRRLRSLGYVDRPEARQADALLRADWLITKHLPDGNADRVTLALVMSDLAGRPFWSAVMFEDVPVAFLTPERVSDRVRETLATLPSTGTFNRAPQAGP